MVSASASVGDVIVEPNDIFGDGVNIAARLEGIAEPGGICLSQEAWQQVKGKIKIAVRDMGDQQLKNIAEPIRVYSVSVDGGVSFGDGTMGSAPPRRAVAFPPPIGEELGSWVSWPS